MLITHFAAKQIFGKLAGGLIYVSAGSMGTYQKLVLLLGQSIYTSALV